MPKPDLISATDTASPLPEDPLLAAATSFANRKGLSARETEVFLRYTTAGRTNKEIAADLGIGYPTVKLYWSRICRKLGCACSVEAAMICARDALVRGVQ